MIARVPTESERERMDDLFAIAFEMPLSRKPRAQDTDPARDHPFACFTDAGEMTSCLTVTDFTVQFDGHAVGMGGVGGVGSLPQYRRQGGVRLCFGAALADMYARGVALSYLYPFSTAFYRRFGYECGVQKYGWTVDLRLLAPRETRCTLRLCRPGDAMVESIRAVEDAWARRYNMMVLHTPLDYRWAERPDPVADQTFTYVSFGPDGAANATVTFRRAEEPQGHCIACSRFFFLDAEGFNAIMCLFKRMSADHRFARFQTPALPGLRYLLPEWSMGAPSWQVHNAGMVRAVNVQALLERARYQGGGSATIEIRDAQLPQNDGRFAVAFEDGRAVSVARTQAAPDVSMPICAFSALIMGVCDFAVAARCLPDVTVHRPDAPLERIFFQKPCYIVDSF